MGNDIMAIKERFFAETNPLMRKIKEALSDVGIGGYSEVEFTRETRTSWDIGVGLYTSDPAEKIELCLVEFKEKNDSSKEFYLFSTYGGMLWFGKNTVEASDISSPEDLVSKLDRFFNPHEIAGSIIRAAKAEKKRLLPRGIPAL